MYNLDPYFDTALYIPKTEYNAHQSILLSEMYQEAFPYKPVNSSYFISSQVCWKVCLYNSLCRVKYPIVT